MSIRKVVVFGIISIFFFNCKKNIETQNNSIKNSTASLVVQQVDNKENVIDTVMTDTIELSKKHSVNTIKCDLDGDNIAETIQIVRNVKNGKSGLRIIYKKSKKTDFLGLGKDVLNQGFDELDWVGIFEVAPKNEIYYSNVNDEGEIIMEDEVKEDDKIKLKNDGIFIHADESCGGGVIYFENGKYHWIQQE